MQIWHQSPQEGRGGADGEQEEEGDMEWDEEVHGFKGAWEMSAQEAFSHFIGQEGLTLERYQVRSTKVFFFGELWYNRMLLSVTCSGFTRFCER